MSWLKSLVGKINPNDQLKKHLKTEEFDKLQKLSDMYIGVTNSINDSIDISNRITAKGIVGQVNDAVSECMNNHKCPVNYITDKICMECAEKECLNK
jgi:hypothetical protein